MNRTDAATGEQVVAWIVFPIALGALLYTAAAACVWPYARPLFPLWILLLCILFPPFFPLLLFYLLFALAFGAYRRPVVVWVPPPAPRARPAVTVRRSGNAV